MSAAFDLDGTLLLHNSSLSFCRYLRKQKVINRSDILYCFTTYIAHILLGFSLWNVHTRVFKRLFRGKSVASLSMHVEPFIQTLKWYEPALARLNQLRESGVEIYIFSNSPHFLVKPIAALIGVDKVVATDYKIDKSGCLWDIATFVDGEKKSQLLKALGEKTTAFSDSHHDMPFLEAASQAIVVRPTRRLFKIASKRNWEVL